MIKSDENLLDVKDVAAITGLSKSALDQWRIQGKGPRFLKLGKAVRYRRSDIEDYIDSRTFQSTSEATASKKGLLLG